jgi:hypothetical protein
LISVGHRNWTDFQIFVPVDADHQLTVQVAVRRTSGLGALMFRLRLRTYLYWFHRILLQRREDGFIVEAMNCPPERLFRPDIAVVEWRQWCDANARHSPATPADEVPAAKRGQ